MTENPDIPYKVIPFEKWNVHYVEVGHGPHVVLAMPGTLGTIWSNYKELVEDMDREKFTLVVWDPPGFGKSRPPAPTFTENYYDEYAESAIAFMEKLGYNRYSVVGWCGGGRAAIIMAGRWPKVIRSIVIWCVNSHMLEEDRQKINIYRDVDRWATRQRDPSIEIYGRETLIRYWNQWADSLELLMDKKGGNICDDYLEKVECPTFLMFAEKDPVIDKKNAPLLHERIKGSKLYIDPGTHDFHKTKRDEFNKRVQEFLLEN